MADLQNSLFLTKKLPRRNKLSWMDDVLFEISRDESVRELLQHIQSRANVEVEKVQTVSDVISDLDRMLL